MPLRDHFRPPLSQRRSWEGVHGQWPAMMVLALNRVLPAQYVAEPLVHPGTSLAVDVASYLLDQSGEVSAASGNGGSVPSVLWAPPEPTTVLATELPDQPEYSVRV